jgi:hypothetical protein
MPRNAELLVLVARFLRDVPSQQVQMIINHTTVVRQLPCHRNSGDPGQHEDRDPLTERPKLPLNAKRRLTGIERGTTMATDRCQDVRAGEALVASPNEPAALMGIIRQTREMIRHVDNARDAAFLVRRANATEKLLDEALKSYRLLEDEQFELKQDVAETHIRTQRRAGELLLKLGMHRGGRPRVTPSAEEGVSQKPPTLHELGISVQDSHRWQRIASLPVESFEEFIRHSREARRELTRARVLAVVARYRNGVGGLSESDRSSVAAASGRKALRYLREIVRLDPVALTSGMATRESEQVLDSLQQLRRWLDEAEHSVSSSTVEPIDAQPVPPDQRLRLA